MFLAVSGGGFERVSVVRLSRPVSLSPSTARVVVSGYSPAVTRHPLLEFSILLLYQRISNRAPQSLGGNYIAAAAVVDIFYI